MSDKSRRVRRYAWETFAVVSGILIAFALDAGWNEYREARELRESLEVLRSEFRDSRVQLDSVIAVNERAIAATLMAFSASPEEISGLSQDSAFRLLQGLNRSDTFNPSQTAIQALIGVNVLEQIPDPALRAGVAAWSGALEDLAEEQVEVRRMDARVRDFVAESGVGADFHMVPMSDWIAGTSTLDVVAVLEEFAANDPSARLFAARRTAVELMLLEQTGVSERIDDILAILDAELR